MEATEQQSQPGRRKFNLNQVINRLGQNEVAEELDLKIKDAVRQALAHDGKSTVTLTITVMPSGKTRPGDINPFSRPVEMEGKVTLKTPTVEHSKSVMFMDEDGDLTPDDPKQMLLGESR